MEPRVACIIARMEEDLQRPPSITELAADVNLSASRLAHLFREETGTPPARYLHDLRLSRARVLLERTSLSINQVMNCVGLNDPSHFTRDFKRAYGMPPSHLRRSWATDYARHTDGGPEIERS
jgi:AraC family transcriptional regulator, arabinose operon regulatory protein